MTEFICYAREARPESLVRSKYFGWPLGLAALKEAEVVVYGPLHTERWAIRVPYEQISKARLESFLVFNGIRVHRHPGCGGEVLIKTLGDGASQIAKLLEDRGIHVVTDQRRASPPAS